MVAEDFEQDYLQGGYEEECAENDRQFAIAIYSFIWAIISLILIFVIMTIYYGIAAGASSLSILLLIYAGFFVVDEVVTKWAR